MPSGNSNIISHAASPKISNKATQTLHLRILFELKSRERIYGIYYIIVMVAYE